MSTQIHSWREPAEASERRNVTLSVNAELLSTAKAMNIDLAEILEEALRAKTAAQPDRQPLGAPPVAANGNRSETPRSW